MQGHVAAVVAVTRHKFASLLGLVGDPAEVEGLPFVGIVVLAVKALVSANNVLYYSDQHHYRSLFIHLSLSQSALRWGKAGVVE